MKHLYFTAALVLGLTGCQTLRVTRVKTPVSAAQSANGITSTSKADGLPFYIKKAACKHEVVWLEPVYSLSLEEITTTTGSDAKPVSTPRGNATLSLFQYRGKKAQDFLRSLNTVDQRLEDVLKAWNEVTTDPGVPYTATGFPDAKDRILISNSNSPSIYVDYSQPHFLNAKQPLAGSSKVDGKLAADGTLTEASAEVDNKTLETILSSLPIKEAITGGLGFAAKADNLKQEKQLKLTVLVVGYKHTVSQLDASALMPCNPMGTEVAGQYTYSREDIGAPTGEKKDDSKGPKVRLSGEITLPEPKKATATDTKLPQNDKKP